jgi:hypothetical protein
MISRATPSPHSRGRSASRKGTGCSGAHPGGARSQARCLSARTSPRELLPKDMVRDKRDEARKDRRQQQRYSRQHYRSLPRHRLRFQFVEHAHGGGRQRAALTPFELRANLAAVACQNCQTIWRSPPCLNQLGLGARPWIGDAPLLRDRAAASTPQKYLFGGSPCPWASPPNARR